MDEQNKGGKKLKKIRQTQKSIYCVSLFMLKSRVVRTILTEERSGVRSGDLRPRDMREQLC